MDAPKQFQSFHNDQFKSGASSIFVANEDVSITYSGFLMSVSLKDIIHLKASQLVESGIINRYIQQVYLQVDKEPKPQATGPQVLTVKHLPANFIIIFGLLAISIIVFMFECAPKLMKMLKKQLEMCLMCFVVSSSLRRTRCCENCHRTTDIVSIQKFSVKSVDFHLIILQFSPFLISSQSS
jgi:hypothetical protein